MCPPPTTTSEARAYLGQVSQLVGIEQQFLQTPLVAVDLIGHIQQRAVAFIDHLHMTVAPPQGDAVKHHGGKVRTKPRGSAGTDADATDCCDGCNSRSSECVFGAPVERLLRRHEHGNYFPGFVPLCSVNLRPCRPPRWFFLFQPALQRWNAGCISRVEDGGILRYSGVFFLSLSARPGVDFLSRLVSDPEHSLPHSIRRHGSWPLLPPAPPLDGPVPRAAIMRPRARVGVEEPGGQRGETQNLK